MTTEILVNHLFKKLATNSRKEKLHRNNLISNAQERHPKEITAQKLKFSIKDNFSKCDQIRSFLRIWSYLLKKSVIENFIFLCSGSRTGFRKIIRNLYEKAYFSKMCLRNATKRSLPNLQTLFSIQF